MLLNNQQITAEIKKEIKLCLETRQWKHNNPKPMGFSKSSAKREVHTNTSLPQETRETSNINLTLHLKHVEKEEQKPTVSRRKEIVKIRAKIKEKEMKETKAKISKNQ